MDNFLNSEIACKKQNTKYALDTGAFEKTHGIVF